MNNLYKTSDAAGAKAAAARKAATSVAKVAAVVEPAVDAVGHFGSGALKYVDTFIDNVGDIGRSEASRSAEEIAKKSPAQFLADQRRTIRKLKQAGGIAAGGITLGLLATYLRMKSQEQQRKSQNIYGLQELQSDIAPDTAVFGNLEKESSMRQQAWLAATIAAAGLPLSYHLFKMYANWDAAERLKNTEKNIDQLRQKYDQTFRNQVLEDLNVPEEKLKPEVPEVPELPKTSSVMDWALQHQKPIAASLLGTAITAGSFQKGLKDAEAKSETRNKVKAYKNMMSTINRTRNLPVQLKDVAFTPEEMIMLERVRKDAMKKPSRKKHMETVDAAQVQEVAADTQDPELKALLSSI